MRVFILRWINTTIGVVVATWLMPHALHYDRPLYLILAALILGILNAFLRPIMLFFTMPLVFLTLGLFTFVINAVLLYFVGWVLSPGFQVHSFWSAFWGALIITIISGSLNLLTGTSRTQVRVQRHQPPPQNPPGGGGPIIDV
jgi:putative membrane protein